jgi:hypothetical protein
MGFRSGKSNFAGANSGFDNHQWVVWVIAALFKEVLRPATFPEDDDSLIV